MEARDEFIALMDRYAFTQKSVGLMLDRTPDAVRSWIHGRAPVPPQKLNKLRRIVKGIDDTRVEV